MQVNINKEQYREVHYALLDIETKIVELQKNNQEMDERVKKHIRNAIISLLEANVECCKLGDIK